MVTQDTAYMEGIKLYGIGIKEDPVRLKHALTHGSPPACVQLPAVVGHLGLSIYTIDIYGNRLCRTTSEICVVVWLGRCLARSVARGCSG